MKTISHNYPKPLSIEAQEWGTLYTKWVKAKLSGDYKLADTLRGWAEFYHGETFVRVGDAPYHSSQDGKPTVSFMSTNEWSKRYSKYLLNPIKRISTAGYARLELLDSGAVKEFKTLHVSVP